MVLSRQVELNVGWPLGTLVGGPDGEPVGYKVGDREGAPLGANKVGARVGCAEVGTPVGAVVEHVPQLTGHASADMLP